MNYSYPATAPRWGVFEVTMPGRTEGNPFTDYTITATFTGKEGSATVDGFYDGDGVYKARFMPAYEGEYTFKVTGDLTGFEGEETIEKEGNKVYTLKCHGGIIRR